MESILSAERIYDMLVFFPGLMLAVVFHEVGHGWMAKRFGDTTAEDAGRLTFNPVPHVDPVGTVLFPVICFLSGVNFLFGWAKPVPIDPRRFSSFRKGLFWVSAAGPVVNFILAIVSAVLATALHKFAPEDFYLKKELVLILVSSVGVNFTLGIFNLLPLPPLDGSKMVESFLPLRLAFRFEQLSRYGTAILLILMLMGALRFISGPIQTATLFTLNLADRVLSL